LFKAAGQANYSQRSLKNHRLAAHLAQLGHGPRVLAWFAQGLARQIGHLVRANHHRFRVQGGHGPGFGQGQALSQSFWRFTRLGCFVDIGCGHRKRDAQALEQLAPVT
jgi:hypothetical protein